MDPDLIGDFHSLHLHDPGPLGVGCRVGGVVSGAVGQIACDWLVFMYTLFPRVSPVSFDLVIRTVDQSFCLAFWICLLSFCLPVYCP